MKEIAEDVRIADDVEINARVLRIGKNTILEKGCEIYVDRLVIGQDSIIRKNCVIRGRDIETGHHFYMDHHAEIGGGSCFGRHSRLRIGHHFHLGSYSMVNTAREVTIGNEVGIGRLSNIYTHGAYLNVLLGFPEQWGPVRIGSNVWIPCATILPNVTIGDNTVIAACSLVNKDIEGGGLWAGIPAERVEGVVYPNPWPDHKRKEYLAKLKEDVDDFPDELRRHGIRDPAERSSSK